MQNKAFISFIAIVVALACIYHLSFTVVTKKIESDAAAFANGDSRLERAYLDSVANEPILGQAMLDYLGLYSYETAKQRELNLGLDLKGGMNLTIEVSVADLLKVMSNDSKDPLFLQALKAAKEKSDQDGSNFIDNFVAEAQKIDPNVQLSSARLFGHSGQATIKVGDSNEQVIAILKKEADQTIDRTFEVLNSRIDQFGVTQPNIQKLETTGRILIELPGIKDPDRAVELVQKTAKLEFWETVNMNEVAENFIRIDEYLAKMKKADKAEDTASVAVAAETTPAAATPEDSLQESNLAANLAAENAETPEDSSEKSAFAQSQKPSKKDSPLFSIFQMNVVQTAEGQLAYGGGALLGYCAPTDTAEFNNYLRIPQVAAMIPRNVKLFWGYKAEPMAQGPALVPVYCISAPAKGRAALEGDVVTDADYEKNPDGGGFMVRMYMNSEGADKWAKITEANMPAGEGLPGKAIAIVLDGKVYSAPTVQNKITGGVSSITGRFTFEEAKSLAAVLKSGKLPVPATIVEKAVVGPSMGAEAIQAGLISLLIAFVIVLIYMIFYYNGAGVTANIALLCNVFFLVGTLASIGTTLTLPGIAGIVLTFGMSVDANVLIFERIREELAHGKGLRMAVSEGFSKAYSSIIDGNVTTLLTALILMIFGAGPTRGFAVTLFCGILTSLFCAIFITRLVFEAQLARKKDIKFGNAMTNNAFKKININFIGKRKIYYAISTVIILIGVVSFFTRGFNQGVDLNGGRTYTVEFDNSEFSTQDVANALTPSFGNEAPTVKLFGADNRVKIVTKYEYNNSTIEVEQGIVSKMYEALKGFYKTTPTYEQFADEDSGVGLAGSEKVGPSIAGDTKTKSIYAILFSLVLMFLYIVFRFRGWQFGVAAIVALIHDVLFVLTCFSLLNGILPFSMEIDQAIIAAILTVIGYSINDTVIVFDRIREYFREHKRGAIPSLVNSALNSTLSRTFNTSFTTLVVLLIAFIFGGPGIRSMSFALLIGIGVGTYSSLCIASTLVVDLKKTITDEDAEVKKNEEETYA